MSPELYVGLNRANEAKERGGETMKKLMLLGLAVMMAIMLGTGIVYAQMTGPGMVDQGRGWGQGYGQQPQRGWNSPYNGGLQQGDRNRDFGRTGRGWGMEPDQRGRGWGTGPGMMSRFWGMFSSGRMGRGWGMGSGCR